MPRAKNQPPDPRAQGSISAAASHSQPYFDGRVAPQLLPEGSYARKLADGRKVLPACKSRSCRSGVSRLYAHGIIQKYYRDLIWSFIAKSRPAKAGGGTGKVLRSIDAKNRCRRELLFLRPVCPATHERHGTACRCAGG